MRKLWELYLEWRIRRLAVKLMLSGGVNSGYLLDEANRLYRCPLPPLPEGRSE